MAATTAQVRLRTGRWAGQLFGAARESASVSGARRSACKGRVPPSAERCLARALPCFGMSARLRWAHRVVAPSGAAHRNGLPTGNGWQPGPGVWVLATRAPTVAALGRQPARAAEAPSGAEARSPRHTRSGGKSSGFVSTATERDALAPCGVESRRGRCVVCQRRCDRRHLGPGSGCLQRGCASRKRGPRPLER